MEDATCLPGDGSEEGGVLPWAWPPPTIQVQTETCFSSVTKRFSGSFGMKISLALGEPALWSVTDGDSWHTQSHLDVY